MIPPAKQPAPASPPQARTTQWTALQLDAAGAASLILFSAAVYLLGISPLLDRHALAIRQQQELAQIREKGNESQTILADLTKQSAVAAGQLQASPLRLQPVSLLNQRLALVTDLAVQGGATLDDLQPGKGITGARFDALPIHAAGTGSFPAFTAMLHQVHAEFPDVAVSTFDMSGDPQGEAAQARFSVDLLWYTEPAKRVKNGDAAKGNAK